MSSLIGHSLVGWTIFTTTKDSKEYNRYSFIWLIWFILIAIAADFDYIVPFLAPGANGGIRITHSLVFCQILPVLTLLYLRFVAKTKQNINKYVLPLMLTGLSHLILDLAVGVTSLPLFFPFSNQVFKLPFGILPSAGKISLSNYYFYHNLAIELGVLIPLSFCSYLLQNQATVSKKRLTIFCFLVTISLTSMYCAYNLDR